MMPVQTITLRGVGYEHTKPLYLCEVCMAPASYGFTVLENNHRKRRWYCREHNSERIRAFKASEGEGE